MAQTKYKTYSLPCGLNANKFMEKFDALVQEKSAEGWKLFQFEYIYQLGICVIVFETNEIL